MFKIYDQQRKDAQASIDALNKQGADIAAGKTANLANYTNLTVSKPGMAYQDIQRQTAVDDLVNKGITDPNQILTELNKTGNFTLDQIQQNLQEHYNPTGFRQAMEEAGNKKYQLDEAYNERKKLVDETTQLSQMMYNDLQAEKNRPALLSVSQGRQANIKEDYIGRISLLQATAAAIDGNINLARTFIDRGIEAVNADRNDRISFLNFYNGLLSEKDSDTKTALLTATEDEKKAITDEIGMLQGKITETENNKANIIKLLTDTQTAQIAVKAGVLVTDTPDKAVTKMSQYMKDHPSEFDNGKVTYQKIGVDADGNDIYGFVDTGKQTVNSGPMSNITPGGGMVATSTGETYNISSYATDPNHETSVQTILNNIGQFKTVQDIDNYIKKVAPNSPITGAMVQSASQKYGASWEMMVAIMQQDSNLGTAGKGARTFNPGNVGNTDSGAEVNRGNWQSGVDAVAQNLAGRKTTVQNTVVNQEAADWVKLIKNKEAKLSDVKGANDIQTSKLKKDVINLMANSGSISKADAETTAKLQDKVNQIDDLIIKTSTAGSGVVGPTWLARWSFGNTLTGVEQDFVGSVKQLISKETLDTLINLKKSGGTLGALSDQERLMLQNAATKIGAWELKDKNGNGKGVWAVSEKSFKKELENIKTIAKRALENAGGETGIVNSLEQALAANPDKIEEYNLLVKDNSNLTDDEIIQLLGIE